MGKITSFFIASESNDFRPPALSYKAFIIYGLILLLLRFYLGTLEASGAAVENGNLMKLINQERNLRNVTQLLTHSSLTNAATQKSQDMIARDYFAHVDPDGNYVWGKITGAGYKPYKILGENLALDFATSEGMVKAWIDSPSHRDNLLNPDFVDQGLSALYGDFQDRYTNLTTSLFGTLAVSKGSKTYSYPTPPYQTPYHTPYQTPHETPYAAPYQVPYPAPVPAYETPYSTPFIPTSTPAATPITQTPISPPAGPAYSSPFIMSRIIFSLFGFALLTILGIDSVILYKHDIAVSRSHSSYHFFNFMLIVLLSILIWWW